MSSAPRDPITGTLEDLGLRVERREVGPVQHMLASGLGGLAGSALGAALGFGGLGRGLLSLAGSVVGHVAVTHRVVGPARAVAADGPPSPAAWSDRR